MTVQHGQGNRLPREARIGAMAFWDATVNVAPPREASFGVGRIARRVVLFVALWLASGLVLAASASAYVYWTNYFGNSIGRATPDGTGVNQNFITGMTGPGSIAVGNGHIYWTWGTHTIGRANLDGTGVNQNFIQTVGSPTGLAVDAGHVYWASSGIIGRANVDGTAVNQAFITPPDQAATAVAVDDQYVYWTDTSYYTIGRANIDGTAIVPQLLSAGLGARRSVAVDAGHVYWTGDPSSGHDSIGRYTPVGGRVEESFIDLYPESDLIRTMAVDAGHIYWTDAPTNTIGQATISGSAINKTFITGANSPHGVAVDEAVPPQLSGRLTFAVPGAPPAVGVNVTIAGQGRTRTVTTGSDGRYSVELPAGSYRVTPDPAFRVTATASADCQASGDTCTVNLDQDRAADFTVACEPTLDFHTSMIATGCFIPFNAQEAKWKAVGKFRMDGIDFESGFDKTDPVIFDEKGKTVDGNLVKMSLSAPGWGSGWAAFYVPHGLHLVFASPDIKHTWALTTPWATPDHLTSALGFLAFSFGGSSTFFGFPAHAPAAEVEFTPGQSSLKVQLSFPSDSHAFLDPINGLWKVPAANGGQQISYPTAFRASVIASNKTGVSTIEGSFSPSGVYGIDTRGSQVIAGESGRPPEGTVQLARIGLSWDLAHSVLHALGTIVWHKGPGVETRAFLPAQAFLGARVINIDAAYQWVNATINGRTFTLPGLRHFGFIVNGINKLVFPEAALFWQRFGVHGGVDTSNPLGPWQLGGSIGFTFLPRFRHDLAWFQEVVSIDADGAVNFDPFEFKGKADAKLINKTIIHGELQAGPAGVDLAGDGELDLRALAFPFPATLFGHVDLSFPSQRAWQLYEHGAVQIWGGYFAADYRANPDALGLCVTLPHGLVQGVYYDGEWRVGGCDTGLFGSSPGSAGDGRAVARSAAGGLTFTVGRRSLLSTVAVRGQTAAPNVRLEGPGGLSLEIPPGKPAMFTPAASMVTNAGDKSTYIVFSRPPPGAYRIVPLPGSSPITSLQFARRLPPPAVHATVVAHGCQRMLRWRLRPVPGQAVTFEEQGAQGPRTILTTNRSRGTVVFTPRAGTDAAREILALVEQRGTPRARVVLAHYRVATGASPGPVSRLKARIRRGRLTLSWQPACAASFYAVTVGTGTRAQHFAVTVTRASVSVGKRHHLRASVAAVGYARRVGRTVKITTP